MSPDIELPTPLVYKTRYSYSLLALCERVHQARTGTGDSFEPRECHAAIAMLCERLECWQGSCEESVHYDQAVQTLVRSALNDARVILKGFGFVDGD